MSVEENKALARRWSEEIWGRDSMAAVDELLADDFVFNYPPSGVKPNKEGYKQTVTEWVTPFSDVQCPVEDMVAEGDKVVVRWTWRGTHNKGEYMGVAPTGKQVTVTGVSILRFAGGKIVEEWGEMDILGFMQQLGLVKLPE